MPVAPFGFLLPEHVRADFGFQTGLNVGTIPVGSSFTRNVPGDFFEVPVSVFCSMITNATVANRLIQLVITDGDENVMGNIPANAVQPASVFYDYSWSLTIGSAFSPSVDKHEMPLFPFVLPSGWHFKIIVASMQAGDQIQRVALVLQQYETGLQPDRSSGIVPVIATTTGITSPPATGGHPPAAAPGSSPAPAPAAAPASGPATSPGQAPAEPPAVHTGTQYVKFE